MLIQATSEYLYCQNGQVELDFCFSEKDYDIFTISMADEKDKENYLNFLNCFLSRKNKYKELNNNIPEYGNYLLKFARSVGLHCRFAVDKDNMMFGFFHPGSIQIFNENSLFLEDIINSIKETGSMPLVPFNCSEKSLQEFINIIYPNTFMIQSSIKK